MREKDFRGMNLHDVARNAGVSIATVSRVINGQEGVKGPTRKRVVKALEESNCHPNINARALSVRNNRVIALIVSNLANPYFAEIYQMVDDLAQQNGYEVLVDDTGYSPERLAERVRLMLGRRLAGLGIVVSEMDDGVVRELARSKIPVVVSDVRVVPPIITNIHINCGKGMQRLLDHLRSLGHRRMAFVDTHPTLESITERRKAFLDEMGALAQAKSTIFIEPESPEGGRQAVRDLLSSGFKPTAIVCVNDHMAMGVLKELREHGIRVPEDVSVAGFDNTIFSEYLTPALTTIHIDRERIAHLIFENLTRQNLVGKSGVVSQGREFVIDPQLVVRESTAPACSRWALPALEGALSHR
jgi:DNA-binding LacI/PurR family transcriptional regulator